MARSGLRAVLLAGFLSMGLAACTAQIESRPVPPAPPVQAFESPRPVTFPRDEGPHADNLEWWYYNGHLVADDGVEYGFHFVVFQSLRGAEAVYAAHLGILDVQGGAHRRDYRFNTQPPPPEGAALHLAISEWTLDIADGVHAFQAESREESSLSLTLTPATPPMFHNEIGWMSGPFGWTYYYSWPRMDVQGVLELDGRPRSVTGEAWFDHQWGDFFVMGYPAGWQWMAVQLDDGSALMLNESRGLDGEVTETIGSYMDASGRVTALRDNSDGIRIENLDTWTSPSTGAVYPYGWRVAIESIGVQIEVTPLLEDQEIDEGVPEPAIYWEGKSSVSGYVGGRKVSGRAYVELTGYVQPEPLEWRLESGG